METKSKLELIVINDKGEIHYIDTPHKVFTKEVESGPEQTSVYGLFVTHTDAEIVYGPLATGDHGYIWEKQYQLLGNIADGHDRIDLRKDYFPRLDF